MAEQSDVTIYTDGACSGNPGPGGYGVVLLAGGKRLELSEGYRRTTNNRMELLAVIAALERLNRPCAVRLYSDSQYVVDSVTKRWVYSWQRNNWRKADKKPALNVDLWKRLLPLLEKHTVEFKWVRGHNNNVENERCDELAVAASFGTDLKVDEGFAPAVPA
ncbi:MAG: ribonuclease HI [Bacteroidetes bacterium]|nr:ribonuclease HI [Bacteroidota bacterium]